MAEITSAMVKELREKTGAGMMDCKRALQESGGDLEKAIDWLRKKGLATAQKKAGRSATEGAVGSYIHMGGKVGVLVEVNCETDFTARNAKFQELVKDLAMHIAWGNPKYVRREDVPPEVLEREKAVNRAQLLEQGKPEAMLDKIIPGKLEKFYAQEVLLDQPFFKGIGAGLFAFVAALLVFFIHLKLPPIGLCLTQIARLRMTKWTK